MVAVDPRTAPGGVQRAQVEAGPATPPRAGQVGLGAEAAGHVLDAYGDGRQAARLRYHLPLGIEEGMSGAAADPPVDAGLHARGEADLQQGKHLALIAGKHAGAKVFDLQADGAAGGAPPPWGSC